VAINSGLVQAGVTPDPNHPDMGIFAVDVFGDVQKITRIGDSMTVAPGDIRTVGTVMYGQGIYGVDGGPEDGLPSCYNDASQFAMQTSQRNADRSLTQWAFIARVGGAARLSTKPPIFGTAATNKYGTNPPIELLEYVSIIGDTGFVHFDRSADGYTILLDFTGTPDGITAVLDEIRSGESVFNYSLTVPGGAPYDAAMVFSNQVSGSEYFYWNLLNIPDVDLVGVEMVPEPATLSVMSAMLMLTQYRRCARHARI
jgi:hypothetical protein